MKIKSSSHSNLGLRLGNVKVDLKDGEVDITDPNAVKAARAVASAHPEFGRTFGDPSGSKAKED